MQLSFRKRPRAVAPRASTVQELKPGQEGILDRLEVPEDVAKRLMELGFLPGHAVTAGHSAPGGDPRVFRVDGSEIALRLETAAHLHLRAVDLDSPPCTDSDCP